MKQKLIAPKNRQVQKHKWDRQSLNQNEKISKYQESLQLMLQEIKEETDIDKDWQNIKQGILNTVTEFQLARGVKKPNHWWDDECKKAIQEKNAARTRLIRKTRANLDNYWQKSTKANRTCRRKKKEWLERKIKEISESNRKKDTRKFYKDIKNLSYPHITTLVFTIFTFAYTIFRCVNQLYVKVMVISVRT
jgi:hypothetical protein